MRKFTFDMYSMYAATLGGITRPWTERERERERERETETESERERE